MELILIIICILLIAVLIYGSTYVTLCDENKLKKNNKFLDIIFKKQGKAISRVEFLVTAFELIIGGVAVEKYLMPLMYETAMIFSNATFLILKYISIFLVTVFATYITMILGTYIPKHLAVEANKNKVNNIIMYIYAFISYIFLPLTFISNLLDTKIKHRINTENKNFTSEKIKEIANVEYDNGNISKLEKQVLSNLNAAFDFKVGAFCIKFDKVVYATTKSNFDDIINIIQEKSMSRILYLNKDLNKVLGVIYAKDLLNNYDKLNNKKISIKKILRQPVICDINESAYTLFNRMLKNKIHIALVKDEMGNNYGIVTMEDIIENILGQIKDEYDK